MTPVEKVLVLALGNELAGDDAVGLIAARELRKVVPAEVDIIESGEAGLALLDHFSAYDRVLLLDAVVAPDLEPGRVLHYRMSELRSVANPSPHYAGLPDVQRVAAELGIPYPKEVRALAVAIQQPERVNQGLSEPVSNAVPNLVAEALSVLQGWTSTAVGDGSP